MSRRSNMVKRVVIPLGKLGLSYALVFAAAKWGHDLSFGEKFISTVLIFTAWNVLELLLAVGDMAARGADESRLWVVRNDCDSRLQNIRTMFAHLVEKKYSENDLFVNHFIRHFQELEQTIHRAAERDELLVLSHHFESVDSVLSAFSGEAQPVLRYTWVIESGERLFPDADEPGKKYFHLVDQMVRKKHIKTVQALLIVDSLSVLMNSRVAKLLDFYKTTKGFECRIILRDQYERVRSDSQIPNDYVDFGIYGKRLMFLTEKYEPYTMGMFVKNAAQVDRYTAFFSQLWGAQAGRANPSSAQQRVTCQALLEFDECS